MSRKKPNQRQLTIYLEESDLFAVDNFMIHFGLNSRAEAGLCLLRAGSSAIPEDTAAHEVIQVAVRATRKNEFQALADFYTQRAALFRSGG